jgi:hypothetical protein
LYFLFIQVEGMKSHLFLLSLLGTVSSSPILEDDRGEHPHSGGLVIIVLTVIK